MCGRYSLTADPRAAAEAFDLAELPPRCNVPLSRLRWELVPLWGNSPNDGPRPTTAVTAGAGRR